MLEVTKKPHLHRDWIDSHAYGIVKALQKAGHPTYLVGGCVRDLLAGAHPKDFDIATAAVPQQVKRLIFMSFIIGKRFRLVLVKREEQQFEVATFRRETKPEDFPEGEVPFGDNIFGTPEEDARRRDFTCNGLFYDPVDDQLIDYVEGLPDIEKRILRMIGNPDVRLIEDPIRILRGIRLAQKLGFTIEPVLRASMMANASSLEKSVLPRRREEILKIMRLPDPAATWLEFHDLGILKYVIPTLHDFLDDPQRQSRFFESLEGLRAIGDGASDPIPLFAWLVYAFLQAAHGDLSPHDQLIALDGDVFQKLMRDELGMFKLEQALLVKAVSLIQHMAKIDDFQRRGDRRQMAFIRGEGFRLGLLLGEADHRLTPQELAFWRNAQERFAPEIQRLNLERKRTPRTRNARRAPRENGPADEGTDLPDDLPDSDENRDESRDRI